jgi:uncharacterized membrane protein
MCCGSLLTSLCVLLAGQLSGQLSGQDGKPVPVFTKDIEPILDRHCITCHRPGGKAPMALTSYEQVSARAHAVENKVAKGSMPPGRAKVPRLTAAEKDLISRWVASGAPRGGEIQ